MELLARNTTEGERRRLDRLWAEILAQLAKPPVRLETDEERTLRLLRKD